MQTTTYINTILATPQDLAEFHWCLASGSAEILGAHIFETENTLAKYFTVGY